MNLVKINSLIYRRGTGERECGERERVAPPRRRSLGTGETLR